MRALLASVALVAALIPVGFAKADSTPLDPTVVINKTGDPTCTIDSGDSGLNCFSSIAGIGAFEIDLVNGLLPAVQYTYAGPLFSMDTTPLNTLFVILDGVNPSEQYTCASDFSTCSLVASSSLPFWLRSLEDGSNFDVFEFTNFTSSFSTGAGFDVSVTTSEPGTMLLFLTGLVPLGLFRRSKLLCARSTPSAS